VQWPLWGVPGGLYDRTDQGTFYNATREFVEELGLMPPARTQRTTSSARHAFVKSIMRIMMRTGTVFEIANNAQTGYTAFALIVDNALEFERTMRLPAAGQPLHRKANVSLSNETRGYTWVTEPVLENVSRIHTSTGGRYNAIKPPTFSHPLRLRRGVVGPQMSNAFTLA